MIDSLALIFCIILIVSCFAFMVTRRRYSIKPMGTANFQVLTGGIEPLYNRKYVRQIPNVVCTLKDLEIQSALALIEMRTWAEFSNAKLGESHGND